MSDVTTRVASGGGQEPVSHFSVEDLAEPGADRPIRAIGGSCNWGVVGVVGQFEI